MLGYFLDEDLSKASTKETAKEIDEITDQTETTVQENAKTISHHKQNGTLSTLSYVVVHVQGMVLLTLTNMYIVI